jgi:hypothetical protein
VRNTARRRELRRLSVIARPCGPTKNAGSLPLQSAESDDALTELVRQERRSFVRDSPDLM